MEQRANKFKPGDKVRRLSGSYGGMNPGDVVTIKDTFSFYSVTIVEHPEAGTCNADNFELVEELPKTDQELADEYRAAYAICDNTLKELEKRGYTRKIDGKPYSRMSMSSDIEFERVVTNVEKI